MHALIVDDSQVMRALLAQALSALHFTVSDAGDVSAALDGLDDGPAPDVVIADHNLPGQTGLQLVAALRARTDCAHVKVLMVSAEGHQRFVQQALDAGVDEYLFKPFTLDALASKLELLALVPQPRASAVAVAG